MAKSEFDWGFPFGVDGVVPLTEAAELSGCSTQTLYRLWNKNRVRIGKHAGNIRRGKAVVCKRSLHAYLASSNSDVSHD